MAFEACGFPLSKMHWVIYWMNKMCNSNGSCAPLASRVVSAECGHRIHASQQPFASLQKCNVASVLSMRKISFLFEQSESRAKRIGHLWNKCVTHTRTLSINGEFRFFSFYFGVKAANERIYVRRKILMWLCFLIFVFACTFSASEVKHEGNLNVERIELILFHAYAGYALNDCRREMPGNAL